MSDTDATRMTVCRDCGYQKQYNWPCDCSFPDEGTLYPSWAVEVME